ncbi:Antitoxin [Candidatus Hydrogenisulfobacillus filiaventi]|uniref:Antitoxin n=1 Tax=Candidatus Hydrogenisulfobacillus filiaventi TaxID=2707344 RepID=A0A6F8ZEF8_9FIRM|nr:type II toxin-antitoxin system prevent-host-death family antitoxin [Bacillota bacterium]CAB1128050.1 Antitoxin [Candidatus Hydrogenisulfobacillus filiaventi]
MEQIGAYDAKVRLAELLNRVAQGETILITKNGKPMAYLTPPPQGRTRTVAEAAEALKKFAKGRRLEMPLKEAIEEGRRH